MIVGEAELKRRRSIDREKSERRERAFVRERSVELALDFFTRDFGGVLAAGQYRELYGGGSASKFEAPAPMIDRQAG